MTLQAPPCRGSRFPAVFREIAEKIDRRRYATAMSKMKDATEEATGLA